MPITQRHMIQCAFSKPFVYLGMTTENLGLPCQPSWIYMASPLNVQLHLYPFSCYKNIPLMMHNKESILFQVFNFEKDEEIFSQDWQSTSCVRVYAAYVVYRDHKELCTRGCGSVSQMHCGCEAVSVIWLQQQDFSMALFWLAVQEKSWMILNTTPPVLISSTRNSWLVIKKLMLEIRMVPITFYRP